MNIEEILNSDLLQRYILGETSLEETLLVESSIIENNSVKQKLFEIESDLEKMAFENKINPPSEVEKKLFSNLEPRNRFTKNNYWWLAASLVVGLSLGFLLLQSNNKLNTLTVDLQKLKLENDTLQTKLAGLEKNNQENEKWNTFIQLPTTKKFVLKPTKVAPNTIAISYVNEKDKMVVLDLKSLPEITPDEDFQVWADIDGEMIDMGVVENTSKFIAMQYLEASQSINITIEPKGGSLHPTVERLIANAYL